MGHLLYKNFLFQLLVLLITASGGDLLSPHAFGKSNPIDAYISSLQAKGMYTGENGGPDVTELHALITADLAMVGIAGKPIGNFSDVLNLPKSDQQRIVRYFRERPYLHEGKLISTASGDAGLIFSPLLRLYDFFHNGNTSELTSQNFVDEFVALYPPEVRKTFYTDMKEYFESKGGIHPADYFREAASLSEVKDQYEYAEQVFKSRNGGLAPNGETRGPRVIEHQGQQVNVVPSRPKVGSASNPAQQKHLDAKKGNGKGKLKEGPKKNPSGQNKEKGSASTSNDSWINAAADTAKKSPEATVQAQIEDNSAYDGKPMQDYLKKFRAYLEGNIVNQPEVVDVFMSIQRRVQTAGPHLAMPEPLFLLGPPGLGKDHSVETYVDAIHGEKGAWQKHMFSIPVIKSPSELWAFNGATSGHIGSDDVAPLIRFLVEHSGGRYQIKTTRGPGGSKTEFVVENQSWKPGFKTDGTLQPWDGVLFLNEMHDWAKQAKSDLVKQALSKSGYFKINNHNGGLSEIYVPIPIVMASNEGMGLYSSKDENGERKGRPMSYEQQLRAHQTLLDNPERLKEALLKTNSRRLGEGSSLSHALGIAEELVDRIPNDRIIPMRPQNEDHIRAITRNKLDGLSHIYRKGSEHFPSLNIVWRPSAVSFTQKYHYVKESSARYVDGNIRDLMDSTLRDAIIEGQVGVRNNDELEIGIRRNKDKTASMIIGRRNPDTGKMESTEVLIPFTLKEAMRGKLSEDEISRVLGLADRLNEHIKGMEEITARIERDVAVMENQNRDPRERKAETATRKAMIRFFLGMSGTGKTELARSMAKEIYGSEYEMLRIDFSQVRTVEDLKAKFLGKRTGQTVETSEFMEAYDRADGKFIVLLDEIANAPKDVLKALYDIFDEPVVSTFADRRLRKMGGVIMIGTGNAGEEWFTQIPRDISPEAQQRLVYQIYKESMEDIEFQREFLGQFFSDAFLNRIGRQNIHFMPPLSYQSIREIAHLKLKGALKDLAPRESVVGWEIGFESEEGYRRVLESMELDGFYLWEQGRSLNNFIKEFTSEIHSQLFGKVPDGARVLLTKGPDRNNEGLHENTKEVSFWAHVEGQEKPISLIIKVEKPKADVPTSKTDFYLTSIHEVGHSLVTYILEGDKQITLRQSVRPGAAKIRGEWVRYVGIAQSEEVERTIKTREAVINEVAIWAAGFEAQRAVTVGGQHDAGKGNDMEGAYDMVARAILRWGLSPKFGTAAIPPNEEVSHFLAGKSDKFRRDFEKEVKSMIEEGRKLAREVITANLEQVLIPMAVELSTKLDIKEAELMDMYKNYDSEIAYPGEAKFGNRLLQAKVGNFASRMMSAPKSLMKWAWAKYTRQVDRDAVLQDWVPRPATFGDDMAMTMEEKAEGTRKADVSKGIPLFEDASAFKKSIERAENTQVFEEKFDWRKEAELRRSSKTNGSGNCRSGLGSIAS